MPQLNPVLETALHADDLQRAASFYADEPGLRRLFVDARLQAFAVGGRSVLLVSRRGASLLQPPIEEESPLVNVIQNTPATEKAAAPTEHPADRHPYGVAIDDLVALSLPAQTAPMRCYVGKVVYLGKDGVRIRLMDRSMGRSCGFDVFVRGATSNQP